ncbi:MAG: hypothetical protein AAB449_01405 [Patescibacteria group bacterium]
MIFGRGKPVEKTVLLVDVESGSVGSGLAHLSSEHPPKLFGEHRIYLRVPQTRDTSALAREVEHAAGQAIAHASEVASRLRLHPQTANLGTLQSASLFLSPPWGAPDLRLGKPSFLESLTRKLRGYIGAHVGPVSTNFHTHAGAVVTALGGISPEAMMRGHVLICSIHGEVSELLLLKNGTVIGHGTIPMGLHALLRTLRTHGGISEHEARSVMRLGGHPNYAESLSSVEAHFRDMFRETGEQLFGGMPIEHVFVFARGPEAGWFARSLSHDSLSDLFPEGGTVQVLRSQHLTPFVEAHAANPDSALLLGTLFIEGANN